MINTVALEKKLASTEARKLRRAFKSQLRRSVNVTPSGQAKKSTVTTKFRYGRLDRITFKAPHYVFKQHYGFEGVKSNGVAMRLKETNVLNKALLSTNVLNDLVDGIANIRGEEVMARINFELKA